MPVILLAHQLEVMKCLERPKAEAGGTVVEAAIEATPAEAKPPRKAGKLAAAIRRRNNLRPSRIRNGVATTSFLFANLGPECDHSIDAQQIFPSLHKLPALLFKDLPHR